MEARYVETKRGVALMWGLLGVIFGTGGSLLMGDPLFDSLFFGLTMGLGFAIGVILFFKEEK